MLKANLDIRNKAKENSIELWRIAKSLNISEWTFYRHLREELSEEEKAKIFSIVEELKKA